MRNKITARFIIGYNGRDHVVYENGEIVYENDTILFVGFDFPGTVDRIIEAGNSIVSPGFVDLNALGDIDTTVMNYDQPCSLSSGMVWSESYIQAGTHDIVDTEEENFKSKYALTQLVRNGITTALPVTSLIYREWAETKDEFERIVDSAVGLGLRVYLGPSYRSGVHVIRADGSRTRYWDESRGLIGLEGAVKFIQEYDGSHQGLVRGLLVPSTIETCTVELLKKTRKYSNELAVPIRLHAAQSYLEFRLINEDYGKTPVQHLSSIGFLGPRTIIPHAIYVNGFSRADCGTGPDLEILRDTGAIVAHCPFAVARGGLAMESLERFKQLGIRIGMGTDCYPSDMLMNLRLGSVMCRLVEGSHGVASTADMFRAATLWGANALERPDLGRLAPGSKADLFIISLDGFHVGQVDDPIRTMVLYCNSTDIQTVVINGRMVMENRVIPGVDYAAYSQRAQNYYETLKQSFSERDYLNRPSITLFPENFKMIRRN